MSLNVAVDNLRAVNAVLNYLAPTFKRPRTYTYDPPPNVPQSTAVYAAVEAPLPADPTNSDWTAAAAQGKRPVPRLVPVSHRCRRRQRRRDGRRRAAAAILRARRLP
jgi:hypothetical protein